MAVHGGRRVPCAVSASRHRRRWSLDRKSPVATARRGASHLDVDGRAVGKPGHRAAAHGDVPEPERNHLGRCRALSLTSQRCKTAAVSDCQRKRRMRATGRGVRSWFRADHTSWQLSALGCRGCWTYDSVFRDVLLDGATECVMAQWEAAAIGTKVHMSRRLGSVNPAGAKRGRRRRECDPR